ncbi:MAG: spermine synthase [bacterium]
MKPSVLIAESTTPDGAKLTLRLHDGHYQMRVDGHGLMSTTETRSEAELAERGCEKLAATGQQRLLIGGLGFGFTLRRVLELVSTNVKVQVAELLPAVVAWNREHLQSYNGALVDDARVQIIVDDACAVLAAAPPGTYDAVLLDIDNGPFALVDPGNAQLYAATGLRHLARALRRGGRAVFWSAVPDRAFMHRLTAAGFRATACGAKAYAQAKRTTRTLIIADRPE